MMGLALTAEFVILAFTLSGVFLKLADLYDQKPSGLIFASISAIFMGLLISNGPYSSSIIIGIIAGSALAGKIDQPNLIFGLGLTLVTAIILRLFSTVFLAPDFPLLILFTAAALIDEVGHDKITTGNVFAVFFRFRMALKSLTILLAVLSQLDALQAFGFFCFDLSYEAISFISGRYKGGAIPPSTDESG